MHKIPSIIISDMDVSLPPEAYPGGHFSTVAIQAARVHLGLSVVRQAHLTTERVGFEWTGHLTARPAATISRPRTTTPSIPQARRLVELCRAVRYAEGNQTTTFSIAEISEHCVPYSSVPVAVVE